MSELPVPLRLVPTLTEVVQPQALAPAPAASFLPPQLPSSLDAPPLAADFSGAVAEAMAFSFDPQALMMRRVVQRVERTLEQRLPDMVDQLILAHMQALMPRLRQEIDAVVREAISQAFEKEAPLQSEPP
jgi:hypothetical protein